MNTSTQQSSQMPHPSRAGARSVLCSPFSVLSRPSARRDAIFALALWQARGDHPTQALPEGPGRAFALELVGAVLRHKASLEWAVGRCVKRMPQGELWAALLIGAAQLLVLRVPDHAAIAETVQAAKPIGKSAAAFVNAVLRRLQRERDTLAADLARQPAHVRLNLPKALWTRWFRDLGPDRATAVAESLAEPPRTVLRPLPPFPPPPGCEPHPDDPDFFVVPHSTRLDALPGFAEGHFVAQDPATRPAIDLLDLRPGQRVLDACAAPGGKTAQIAARLAPWPDGTRLVANEPNADRAETLRDTLRRCGFLDRIELSTLPAQDLTGGPFDRILLDVPCSNTGVLGRRPDARWAWTPTRLRRAADLQAQILEACAPLLAPGGRLVYSTCSIEPEEDTLQLQAFLTRHPDFTLLDSRLTLPTPLHDGSFAAALTR